MSFMAPCDVKQSFRYISEDAYPELKTMSRDVMYDNGKVMAPGGRLLASRMISTLNLRRGMAILDLACGRGQSTAMLAQSNVKEVVAVDLWTHVHERVAPPISLFSLSPEVVQLQLDASQTLPFPARSFDVIFCMQSFHIFGSTPEYLKHMHRLLKPNGQICIAQTCFNKEQDSLPRVFKETDGWDAGYETYHSPSWWENHFEQSHLFNVHKCEELPEGDIFWEDDVLYRGNKADWPTEYMKKHNWLMRQIQYGRHHDFRLTHFLLHATAK